MPPSDDSDCCPPIDLKSKDASLPDQCTMGSDAPPSEVRIQKMINDRAGEKCDQWSGMTNNNKRPGIPGT